MIHIEVYKHRKVLSEVWRWKAIDDKGRVLATSAEDYDLYDEAEVDVKALFLPEISVVVV